jgi:hypothetical protein
MKTDCRRLKLRESKTDQEPALAAMLANQVHELNEGLAKNVLPCNRPTATTAHLERPWFRVRGRGRDGCFGGR